MSVCLGNLQRSGFRVTIFQCQGNLGLVLVTQSLSTIAMLYLATLSESLDATVRKVTSNRQSAYPPHTS